MPPSKQYAFSTTIGAACTRQMVTFADLADRRKWTFQLMRECNGKAPPSKALVKGLAKKLEINEHYLEKLAEEVRKGLGAK